MTLTTGGDFLAALRELQLLSPAQADQLAEAANGHPLDARGLARCALERNLLTSFQVNQLFLGRGRELLLGPYVVLERIGNGGAGQVFKARHLHLKRIVAVKVILPDLLTDQEIVQRFYREVQVLSRLTHPNIVHAYDAGPIGNTHFLAMEYIDGTDLHELVKQRGPLPIPQACDYLWQATVGLHHAHRQGLVHRDVKPANLLVAHVAEGAGPWGLVKLLDLGLARVPRRQTDETQASLTQVGKGMMGTPDYLAPEQALDFHTADIRADLYSLGCTLFYLLTGQPPFPGGSLAQKLMKHQQMEPPSVPQLRPDVPAPLSLILRRLLAKHPEYRFQTPAELLNALAPLAGREPGQGLAPVDEPTIVQTQTTTLRGLAAPTATALPLPPLPLPPPPESKAISYRELQQHRSRRNLIVLAASAVMLIGLGLVFVALLRFQSGANPAATVANTEPALPAADVALKDLRQRLQKVLDSDAPSEPVRLDLIAFRRDHAGTEEARAAAFMLSRLPSPLDKLDPAAIPAEQRFSWQPADLVAVFGEHRGRAWEPLGPIAWSPDGQTIAVGSHADSDSTPGVCIRLFDAATLRERATLRGHGNGFIFGLGFSADSKTMVSSATDYSIRVWSMGGKEPVTAARLAVLGAYVDSVAISPDGRLAASGNVGPAVRLWTINGADSALRAELGGHTNCVHSMSFSADSRTLATCDGPRVRLWDVSVKPYAPLKALEGHQHVNSVCFSAEGKKLVVGSAEGTIYIWDLSDPEKLSVVSLPVGANSERVVLSRDGQWIAAALRYGTTIRLWRRNDRGQYERQADLPTRGRDEQGQIWEGAEWVVADFSPDSKMLATASRDGQVRLWDLPEDGTARPHTMPYDPLRSRGGVSGLALLNADRTLALATDGDSALDLWSLDEATPKLGRSPLLGNTFARSFAPLSTAARFYSIWQNQVASWDIDKGLAKPAGVYPAGDSPVALAISADEKRLAFVGKAAGLSCWDLSPTAHKPLPEIKGLTGPIRTPALSPDGKLLAAVSGPSDKPIIRMWDLGPAGAQERPPLAAFDGAPTALAFAPDGKSLAIGDGWTGRIVLCDWTGDKPRIQVLQGADGTRYHSLAFSPDGKLLLAGGEGPDSLSSWALATGKRSVWRFPGPVRIVAFAADGRHILCGNANGTTYVIRLAAAPTRK